MPAFLREGLTGQDDLEHHSFFIHGMMVVQRGKVTCLKSHSWVEAGHGHNHSFSDLRRIAASAGECHLHCREDSCYCTDVVLTVNNVRPGPLRQQSTLPRTPPSHKGPNSETVMRCSLAKVSGL